MPVPIPGPGEVLVRVAGAGVCHSDLHLLECRPGALPYDVPFTLGHENAGWIEALGEGVSGYSKGDAVAVYGAWGCGTCRHCLTGIENYCDRSAQLRNAGGGLGRDGGMARFMLVPKARWLVPLPDVLDPRLAAPLTDAALTPYHAVKRALPCLSGGSTAVVIGAGGLGQFAIQFLRLLTSARVIALDTSEERLVTARRLGAHEGLRSGSGALDRVTELTEGRGAEVIIDFVGVDETLALSARLARRMGQITIVGIGRGSVQVGFRTTPPGCSVATTYWGSLPELAEVVALAAQRLVTVEAELFSLERAPDAYQKMRAGKLGGRAIVTPNG